jgi:hypothetical protein
MRTNMAQAFMVQNKRKPSSSSSFTAFILAAGESRGGGGGGRTNGSSTHRPRKSCPALDRVYVSTSGFILCASFIEKPMQIKTVPPVALLARNWSNS